MTTDLPAPYWDSAEVYRGEKRKRDAVEAREKEVGIMTGIEDSVGDERESKLPPAGKT